MITGKIGRTQEIRAPDARVQRAVDAGTRNVPDTGTRMIWDAGTRQGYVPDTGAHITRGAGTQHPIPELVPLVPIHVRGFSLLRKELRQSAKVLGLERGSHASEVLGLQASVERITSAQVLQFEKSRIRFKGKTLKEWQEYWDKSYKKLVEKQRERLVRKRLERLEREFAAFAERNAWNTAVGEWVAEHHPATNYAKQYLPEHVYKLGKVQALLQGVNVRALDRIAGKVRTAGEKAVKEFKKSPEFSLWLRQKREQIIAGKNIYSVPSEVDRKVLDNAKNHVKKLQEAAERDAAIRAFTHEGRRLQLALTADEF